MRLRLHRSMLGLIVAGFVLVSVPLIAAIVVAFGNVTQLSRQAEMGLARGVDIAGLGRSLVQEIIAMERNARQYAVLGDQELLDLYRMRQVELEATVARLDRLAGAAPGAGTLNELLNHSQSLLVRLETEESGEDVAAVQGAVQEFARLGELADLWVLQGNHLIDSEAVQLRRNAEDTRRLLVRLLGTAVPAALLMILLFTVLTSRPLDGLARAIRGLGDGRLEQPIHVRGPADLESLGGELEILRGRLLTSEQEKQHFLRHMSHELKTPLASLVEGTELMIDGSLGTLDPAKREVATILRGNAQELRHLIENLLDYSAWQAQRAQLEPSEFEFQILCQQVLDQQRLAVLARELTIDQRIVPVRITADREKLRTVMSNLLSNAVKYSPREGTIHLRGVRIEDSLVIDIGDSGANVPENERERIFEPFFTGSQPADSHLRGSGIGLSLVREYVLAHRGKIELEDGVYDGAHFRVTLPLAGPFQHA